MNRDFNDFVRRLTELQATLAILKSLDVIDEDLEVRWAQNEEGSHSAMRHALAIAKQK